MKGRQTAAPSRRRRRMDGVKRIEVTDVGQIRHAAVDFADLTVLVGPQATGKSVFLQLLKLIVDRDHIHDTFQKYNVSFAGDSRESETRAFLDGYFGDGMHSMWKAQSHILCDGQEVALPELARSSKSRFRDQRLFYIPAQRVVSLRDGSTQNFGQFRFGDPFVLRAFSDTVHDLLQNQYGARSEIFPQSNRLNDMLRQPLEEHVFGGAKLRVDTKEYTKRLVLSLPGESKGLPFLAWSAGQREFTPLLLGMYWLCPVASSTRKPIEWVVLEEPEMGLHPQGIAAVLLLVLELLRRGYRVVMSTHSSEVLALVWTLRTLQSLGGTVDDVRRIFSLPAGERSKSLASAALQRSYAVYFFQRGGVVKDISSLDPGSESTEVSEWGGLLGFSSQTNDVIANAVNRSEHQQSATLSTSPPMREGR